MRRPVVIAVVWLLVCVLLTYVPSIGRGFVADDFGWIAFSRIDSLGTAWKLLVEGAPGFYRPIVALSFGINEMLFGMNAVAYAITNLVMAVAIVAGIVWLGTALRLPPIAAVFGAGLWILNFHGISSALVWISGRTSLLTTLFAVFAAIALVRGRSLSAGWLTLASLMSKEEPVMLPVVLALWLWIDRQPIATIVRLTWPSFAAIGIYLALRARTDAFTPSTAPSFYRLSASPDVLFPNAVAYLDRSMTFTAAVLVLGLIAFARARTSPLERQPKAWCGSPSGLPSRSWCRCDRACTSCSRRLDRLSSGWPQAPGCGDPFRSPAGALPYLQYSCCRFSFCRSTGCGIRRRNGRPSCRRACSSRCGQACARCLARRGSWSWTMFREG